MIAHFSFEIYCWYKISEGNFSKLTNFFFISANLWSDFLGLLSTCIVRYFWSGRKMSKLTINLWLEWVIECMAWTFTENVIGFSYQMIRNIIGNAIQFRKLFFFAIQTPYYIIHVLFIWSLANKIIDLFWRKDVVCFFFLSFSLTEKVQC